MKVGIIGGGKIAERHIYGYKHFDDVEIFIADIDGNITQKICDNLGVNFSIAPEVILGDSTIDIIDVCTPTPFHKNFIVEAIRRRKHVFCEKPLCMNLEEAIQIKRAAEQTDRIVMVGYLYRFHPGFEFAKQVLDEGIIGTPHFAIFRLGGRGSHREWKHKKSEGGGAISEMLVHKLDLILWFFGEITTATTLINETVLHSRNISGKETKADAEDYVVLDINANGTRILCESDLITPSYMDYIEIHGDNGSIFTSILPHFPTVIHCKEARNIYSEGNNFRNFPATNLFEKELGHFLTAVNTRARTMNSIDDSVKIFQIIEQIEVFKEDILLNIKGVAV
jgi:predicted dehydrogenase